MTPSTLQLAKHLSLPLDAVTQTFAIFGKRGSGKTNGATVLVEELLRAHLPVVVLDPVDAWWGLKSSFDGKEPGLPIYIFGGPHGDLPLESTAGILMADMAVRERIPMVLSLKGWGVAERARFVTDFAKQMLKTNSEPVMIVLEEADAFVPQRPAKGEEAMLGEMDRMVRWGRGSGIGCTLITQRSAKVNKDVTTQAETLIAFRTTGPQDRDAIDNWIKFHAGQDRRDDVLSSLPTLPDGTAWVWSPEWLDVFDKYAFRRRTTYDSGATPKVGEKRPKPKELATVDLERLRGQMAATIEKAKADDPRELRRQIAELKAQLSKGAHIMRDKVQPAPKVVEKFVLKDGQLARAEALVERIELLSDKFSGYEEDLRIVAKEIRDAVTKTHQPLPHTPHSAPSTPLHPQGRREPASRAVSGVTAARPARGNPDRSLAGGERKILTALAQYPDGRSKTQVAILTAYAHNGGGFNNYVGALRSKGFIAGTGDRLHITDAGLAALGSYDPLPTGRDLLDYWLRQLGKAERVILEQLAAEYPATLTKDALGERTGYEPNGGGFNNALSRLRSLELIEGRGELRASEELFV